MKTLEIKLANGDELLLVDLVDIRDIPNEIESRFQAEILGVYNKEKGEIDFEVKEEWREAKWDRMTTKEGLLFLLNFETTKAYPLKENPYGSREHNGEKEIWINLGEPYEQQVCSKEFICLLKQKENNL